MATLENVSADELRELLEDLDDPDAIKRVMAAIAYKELDELSQNDAAELFGFSSGWASKWFNRLERLEDEPYEAVVSDAPRSGRPTQLTDSERADFETVLQEPPTDVGLEAPAWTVPLARKYLLETYAVEYSHRHVRRLLEEAGLAWKTARPESDTADERAQAAFQEGFKKSRTIWVPNTRS